MLALIDDELISTDDDDAQEALARLDAIKPKRRRPRDADHGAYLPSAEAIRAGCERAQSLWPPGEEERRRVIAPHRLDGLRPIELGQ